MRYMEEKRQQVQQFIRENPGRFAWFTVERVWYFWAAPPQATMVAGFVLAARRRPFASGVAIGVSTLTKQTAAATLLPAAWLIGRAARARRRRACPGCSCKISASCSSLSWNGRSSPARPLDTRSTMVSGSDQCGHLRDPKEQAVISRPSPRGTRKPLESSGTARLDTG